MKNFKKFLIGALFFAGISAFVNVAFSQDAEYYFFKANSNLNAGKFKDAINLYNQAIAINDSYFEAYIGTSIAYKETGKLDKALENIQKAIEIKPDYYQAYYNMGLILEAQGKNSEAVESYETFLKKFKGAAKFTDVKQRISRLKNI